MLTNRWAILALLVAVRCAMGFQFQSVSSLAQPMMATFAMNAADLGFLIGLYFAPGVVLALPGGAIGQRFGDKRVVLCGLALMATGAFVMAGATAWPQLVAGRLVGGIGAILLNVLMSKMVADWFAGREIATAMAIYVTSWPLGLGLGAVVLPTLLTTFGIVSAWLAAAAFCAGAFAALWVGYRAPVAIASIAAARPRFELPAGAVLWATIAAGLAWGLFNAAISLVPSFAPLLLATRGYDAPRAGIVVSTTLWLLALSTPVGGILADRSGRPILVLVCACLIFAATLAIGAHGDVTVLALAAAGLASGPAAGPIMSLPARVLSPATRATGMGVFFTLFYALQWIGPWLGGVAVKQSASAAAALDVGVLFVLLACAMVGVFWRVARTPASATARLANQI